MIFKIKHHYNQKLKNSELIFLKIKMSLYRNVVWFAKGTEIFLKQLLLLFIILSIFKIGMLEYTKQGFESASKLFNAADLEVDLSKRVIMVTGANSGIGKVTALEGTFYSIIYYVLNLKNHCFNFLIFLLISG